MFPLPDQDDQERARMQSDFSTLCRGNIIPKEVKSGHGPRVPRIGGSVRAHHQRFGTGDPHTPDGRGDHRHTRLSGADREIFLLSLDDTTVLQDMELKAEGFRVGNKHVCLHTLSDTDDLPGRVSTESRYERLSTDRSDCLLSFAAPVGLLLSCDHIYNQWLFLDDSAENLRRFEKSARNMHSLARYSRSNQINKGG